MNDSGRVWHLWFPEWTRSPGGIQRYSEALARAVLRLDPPPRARIFVKNDLQGGARTHAMGRWPRGLRTGAFATVAASWALRDRPELIVATHVNFAPLARLLCRRPGTRYWVAAHGIEAWTPLSPRTGRALREAHRVLCVSRFTRDRIVERHGVPPDRCRVLPNTFAEERFAPAPPSEVLRARLGIAADCRVVLTVARLNSSERAKGIDRVIRALPHVLAEVPATRYVIVGAGDDVGRLRDAARRDGVAEKVVFAGAVPDGELPAYYNLCDVFAMPSRKEGFGIVFLEALGCGKPVVAGNADGSAEPLAAGELGVLVEPEDEKQLARAIVEVLLRRHPNAMLFDPKRLGAAARERFGFESFVRRLAEIAAEPQDE